MRQGNIFDVFFILIVGFLLATMVVIGVFLSNTVNTALQNSTIAPEAKEATQNITDDLPGAADFVLIIILFGLPMMTVVLSFFNDIHPLFFYVSIAVLILIVMAGYAYKILWESLTSTSLGATASSLPMTNFVLSNYGLYSLLVGVMVIIGLYVKLQGQPGYST